MEVVCLILGLTVHRFGGLRVCGSRAEGSAFKVSRV